MKQAKVFLSHFLIAIGTISAFIGAFPWLGVSGYSTKIQIIVSIFILFIGIVYAWFQMRPSKSIQIPIHDSFSLQVEFGDLFEKKGVVVISVNEYFDSIVDNKIIATDTIHGKFIERLFKGRISELDKKIEEALNNVKAEDVPNRAVGKQKRYPLGTCAVITEGENTYILVALTEFDANNHTFIPLSEYGAIIQKIISIAATVANSRPVYMPLLGSGQGGIQKSAQKILSYMISQIEFCPNVSIHKGLYIVVHNSGNKSVNLDNIKSAWLSTIK